MDADHRGDSGFELVGGLRRDRLDLDDVAEQGDAQSWAIAGSTRNSPSGACSASAISGYSRPVMNSRTRAADSSCVAAPRRMASSAARDWGCSQASKKSPSAAREAAAIAPGDLCGDQHRIEGPAHGGPKQPRLVAEIVPDQRRIDSGGARDVPHRSLVVARFGEPVSRRLPAVVGGCRSFLGVVRSWAWCPVLTGVDFCLESVLA